MAQYYLSDTSGTHSHWISSYNFTAAEEARKCKAAAIWNFSENCVHDRALAT